MWRVRRSYIVPVCRRMFSIMNITSLYYRFLILLAAFTAITMQWKFKQNSFSVIFERAEITSYNREYMAFATVKSYKHNRTQTAANGTFIFKKDWNPNVKIQAEAFKFMSNEYRSFPIQFSYSFCECLKNDDFGFGSFLTCGNLTINNCIIKKGTYNVCNFHPKGENFPPHIPTGSYKVEIKWFDGPTEIMALDGYGTVKYPFP